VPVELGIWGLPPMLHHAQHALLTTPRGVCLMVSLTSQKDFRPVQRLSFCYLCGEPFREVDKPDRDHVPPDAAFATEQKEPLLLPTHVACNRRHGPMDEKMAQLLGLLRGYVPSNPNHIRLDRTLPVWDAKWLVLLDSWLEH
jgi:hypothetical protein